MAEKGETPQWINESDPKKHLLDSQGRMRTQSLFYEYRTKTMDPIFTLKPYDLEVNGVVYPSLKKLYLDARDPVEYKFVNKHLYSWENWERILDNAMLEPHIQQWRKELEIQMKAEALNSIIEVSVLSSPSAVPAARYLVDKGWDKLLGRHVKDEDEKEDNRSAIAEDAARIFKHKK